MSRKCRIGLKKDASSPKKGLQLPAPADMQLAVQLGNHILHTAEGEVQILRYLTVSVPRSQKDGEPVFRQGEDGCKVFACVVIMHADPAGGDRLRHRVKARHHGEPFPPEQKLRRFTVVYVSLGKWCQNTVWLCKAYSRKQMLFAILVLPQFKCGACKHKLADTRQRRAVSLTVR